MRTICHITIFFATAFFIGAGNCWAQTNGCNCNAHFDFVKAYMEKNHAAFKDNVTLKNRPVYLKFCQSVSAAIEKDSCKTRCSIFIDRYLKFFKDHHIYIDEPMPPGIDENDSAVLAAFKQSPAFSNTASISLDAVELKALEAKGSNEIQGIYTSFPNPGYSIAIVKRDGKYKGVMLESATKLWERGQVKFVLTPVGADTYSAKVLMKDHSLQEKMAHFNDGTIKELFLSKNRDRATESSPFVFKKINDSTYYIKVRSFVGELYPSLDSFYKAHFQQIISAPYLVIDITDNGGGSDKCYQGLVDFLYTGPIANDPLEMYVTPGNISTYKNELAKLMADSLAYGPTVVTEMRGYIKKMEQAKPYTFIPMDNAGISYTTRKKVYPYPKRVALVYNHNTASSAESFIFDALQSKKVITMGENSGGYTGYGNVFVVPVPGSDLTLGCTTTRYPLRRKFDSIGIRPSYHLNLDGNWLVLALKRLVK